MAIRSTIISRQARDITRAQRNADQALARIALAYAAGNLRDARRMVDRYLRSYDARLRASEQVRQALIRRYTLNARRRGASLDGRTYGPPVTYTADFAARIDMYLPSNELVTSFDMQGCSTLITL